jgi:hypothetical protein
MLQAQQAPTQALELDSQLIAGAAQAGVSGAVGAVIPELLDAIVDRRAPNRGRLVAGAAFGFTISAVGEGLRHFGHERLAIALAILPLLPQVYTDANEGGALRAAARAVEVAAAVGTSMTWAAAGNRVATLGIVAATGSLGTAIVANTVGSVLTWAAGRAVFDRVHACVDRINATQLACLARGVAREPLVPERWLLLGQALSARRAPSETQEPLTEAERAVETRSFRRVQQLIDAAADTRRAGADAVSPAAALPTRNAPDALACFVEALRLDPEVVAAWYCVADELIAGTRHDPSTTHGPTIPLGAEIDGQRFAIWQCLAEGLKRDPNGDAQRWLQLARHVPPSESCVTVGAVEFTRTQCVAQSLALNPASDEAWSALGDLIAPGETTGGAIAKDLRGLTNLDCYGRSLSLRIALARSQTGPPVR